MTTSSRPKTTVKAFGLAGLDDVVRGGLPAERLYLIEGNPGSGKTTLALQFLLEGARSGESVMYVTLSETRQEIEVVAESHGWSLDKIAIYEMVPDEQTLSSDAQLTMFHASELELNETTRGLLTEVMRVNPVRVVIDSLSEVRLLAQSSLRYRRQILALKQFFAGRHCTVLLLDDRSSSQDDLQLQSIAHGVLRLEHLQTHYGSDRRRLLVVKLRGVSFRGGFHDFVIRQGGLEVFPRLVANEHTAPHPESQLASGVPDLDALLGGGLAAGSSTLMLGPAGCGKSTVALLFATEAAQRGERTAMFLFDETKLALRRRMTKLSIDLDSCIDAGLITLQQIDPAEISPGEFVEDVRRAVTGTDAAAKPAKIVIIDSLNGYLNSMSEDNFLLAQLHELFTYLNQLGVLTLVTVSQSGMIGREIHAPIDTTYLADNVILFRYFEAMGQVRRAISVVKKRGGSHELSLREMWMSDAGVHVGPQLTNFQGVLAGTPTYLGGAGDTPSERPGAQ